jgi:hypothetical protein
LFYRISRFLLTLFEQLRKMSKLSGRSFSGRTADSDSANQGSNPCLPAIKNQGLIPRVAD